MRFIHSREVGISALVKLTAVGALLGSAALVAPAGAARPTDECPMALACGDGLAAMVELETRMVDALQSGHAVPVVYRTPEQVPGDVVAAPYWGDTALWSGVYLAGESMRYAVSKHRLTRGQATSRLTQDERAFWSAQREEALARIRVLLAAEHRDVSIAEDWKGELRMPPHVNTQDPRGPHTLDFGGGVVEGQRGMVTRGCTPVDMELLGISDPSKDPANPVNDHANHVQEITWTHGDGGTYNCETSPSRDTYAGLTFGMLTAYDLVGDDEPGLRAQIRGDLLAMGDFLVKYGWSFVRPNGYVSTQSVENNFIDPLMVYVPMARLNIANAARHVAETSADRQRWQAIWAEELASQGPLLGASMEVDSLQPNEGYFKFNLHHLAGFNLLRTTSGAEREVIARAFAVMDKTTRDDLNAHFEAITFALTGDPVRRDAALAHLQQWLAYRAATAGGQAVRNSDRCGSDLTCVPHDQADLAVDEAPGGAVTWHPAAPDAPPLSSSSDLRAARPLRVALRAPADFLWQKPPTELDGQQDATWREPGIDYLSPYWMLRYFTEVAPPDEAPLPEWLGPAHL
jgi:hypothetical protein